MRGSKDKILTLCLLVMLWAHSICAQDITELKDGKELKNESISNIGAYKYYKFIVDKNFKGDRDVTIKTALTEEHPWANPDIYLAKDSKQPNATHFQIACRMFGEDICSINKNEIKAGEEWYIGVTCNSNNNILDKACNYDIVLEYVEEMILEDGVPLTIYLYEDQEKIFRFFVPDDNQIRHIQISARGKDVFSKFQLLTVKGNDPPGTDRRKHAWPAWNNGFVSRFEPGCD